MHTIKRETRQRDVFMCMENFYRRQNVFNSALFIHADYCTKLKRDGKFILYMSLAKDFAERCTKKSFIIVCFLGLNFQEIYHRM